MFNALCSWTSSTSLVFNTTYYLIAILIYICALNLFYILSLIIVPSTYLGMSMDSFITLSILSIVLCFVKLTYHSLKVPHLETFKDLLFRQVLHSYNIILHTYTIMRYFFVLIHTCENRNFSCSLWINCVILHLISLTQCPYRRPILKAVKQAFQLIVDWK